MYTGTKITSNQIAEIIPEWLQNLLWYSIETMIVTEKDHTQFFKLTCLIQDGVIKQRIVHQQQNPYYRKEEIIAVNRAIIAKVIVIDNVSQCFMLDLPT